MDKKLTESALKNIRDILNGKDSQETARRMCVAIVERTLTALAEYDAQQPAAPHYREPWRVGRGSRIEDARGRVVADMTHRPDYGNGPLAPAPRPRAEDDAARIVACVNACAGIADPSRLVPALRAAVVNLDYAVMALQAPERCAMREDLDNARTALEGNA